MKINLSERESQRYDLLQLAKQHGFEVVEEYVDNFPGTRARRPGLDRMMSDVHRHRFDALVVWAFDRLARSVNFLQLIHIGRPKLIVNREAILRDHQRGPSIREIAKLHHRLSRTSGCRVLKQIALGGAA